MDDGAYYDVKNVTPGRADQFKNKRPLWERTGPSVSQAETRSVDPSDQRGETNVSQAADEGKGDAALRLTPEAERAIPSVEADLRARLKRYGIDNRVGFRLNQPAPLWRTHHDD